MNEIKFCFYIGPHTDKMEEVTNIRDDVQVIIVGGIAATVAGQLSEYASDKTIDVLGVKSVKTNIGTLGTDFLVRSMYSAIFFAGAMYLMPGSAGNVVFTYMYFANDAKIVTSAQNLVNFVAGAVKRV